MSDKIVDIPDDYELVQRESTRTGIVICSSIILKFYDMHKTGNAPDAKLIDESQTFLLNEIKKGNIEPYLGLGFAILSEDMLNVTRWDSEYPIVLKNQIYGYKKDFESAELLDIRDVGSFCIYELGIVNHERNAWKKYLESKRRGIDKSKYLNSFFEGLL
ncbi:MAG TPA: hypothetical protein VJB11_00350 [archaeon]|nr:hypothetical protein [archaeon]